MVAGWPMPIMSGPAIAWTIHESRKSSAIWCSGLLSAACCLWATAAWSARRISEALADGHGYLVGLRRRNREVDAWLQQVDEAKWVDCPGGINARERKTSRCGRAARK